jgi:hypothetical protein
MWARLSRLNGAATPQYDAATQQVVKHGNRCSIWAFPGVVKHNRQAIFSRLFLTYHLNLSRKRDIDRHTSHNILRRAAGMATILKDSLQTIQTHRALSPHYTELLDILEEIMILREEYRRRIQRETFPVDEKLIPAKMAGGFPLVDFSSPALFSGPAGNRGKEGARRNR